VANVLSIGDTHAPAMHPDAVAFLSAVADKYHIDQVVHQGDVVDEHAFSRYVHDPDGRSGGDEMDEAADQLGPLYELFPKARVCEGNHDRRIYERAAEVGIPRRFLRELNEITRGPAAWKWDDQWEIEEVIYEHGDPYNSKTAHIQIATDNMQPTVIGHIHGHAGIQYLSNRKHLVYGFNVGCLIERRKYHFRYAKKAKTRPIIGCGVIRDGVPLFQPMPLKAGGRWTGGL
jgi:predicted phosphodiesterase